MKAKKFIRSGTHLPVKDLRQTLNFYRDSLGFYEDGLSEKKMAA